MFAILKVFSKESREKNLLTIDFPFGFGFKVFVCTYILTDRRESLYRTTNKIH